MTNDKRRITARERAEKLAMLATEYIGTTTLEMIVKMLGDHVKAAHRRHARKNVCITKNGLDKETIIGLKTRFNARG